MPKPNISRSIHDLLLTNWSLTGELGRAEIDLVVDQKATTTTNKPTIYIQKGRGFSVREGLPKGVLKYNIREVYIQPFMPTVSGAHDRMWEMSQEIEDIIDNHPTEASGIENVWIAEKTPRSGNLQDPYRGNEVVIKCFWRKN